MKRKFALVVVLVAVAALLAGCPKPTPERVLEQAQTTYLNAWKSYHVVFLAQPDGVRGEWVKKYHPVFEKAGGAIMRFSSTPTLDNEVLLDRALAECEEVLVLLLIKKGGK